MYGGTLRASSAAPGGRRRKKYRGTHGLSGEAGLAHSPRFCGPLRQRGGGGLGPASELEIKSMSRRCHRPNSAPHQEIGDAVVGTDRPCFIDASRVPDGNVDSHPLARPREKYAVSVLGNV